MAANAEITFDANDGDFWDKRWGGEYQSQVCHFKVHPNNVGLTGKPWVLYLHGGGGAAKDGRLPFILNGNGNDIFSGLLAKTGTDDTHFNLLSVTIPQNRFDTYDTVYTTTAGTKENGGFRRTDSLGNGHSQTATLKWNMMRSQENVAYPNIWGYVQAFICWWKSVCKTYGCDPEKGIIIGSSFGGMRAVLSQYHAPLETDKLDLQTRNFYGLKPGVDSKVRGVLSQFGPPDVRRSPQYVLDAGFAEGTYVIPGSLIAQWVGIFPTKANLDRVPNEVLEQMSYLYFAENPDLIANDIPVYQTWERNGVAGGGTDDGGTPGAEIVYPVPGAAAHDESQLFNWIRTANDRGRRGLSREILVNASSASNPSRTYADGFEGDETATDLDVIQEDAYRWMRGCLGLATLPSGKGPLWYSLAASAGGTHAIPSSDGYSGTNDVDTPY